MLGEGKGHEMVAFFLFLFNSFRQGTKRLQTFKQDGGLNMPGRLLNF